jgi:hypothetical protein
MRKYIYLLTQLERFFFGKGRLILISSVGNSSTSSSPSLEKRRCDEDEEGRRDKNMEGQGTRKRNRE